MSNLMYVLVALGLSVGLSVALWLVQRRPRTTMSSIDEFRREMDALARPASGPRRDPASGRRDPASGRRDPASGRRDPASGRRDPASGRREPAAGWRPPRPGHRPEPLVPAPRQGELARELRAARSRGVPGYGRER